MEGGKRDDEKRPGEKRANLVWYGTDYIVTTILRSKYIDRKLLYWQGIISYHTYPGGRRYSVTRKILSSPGLTGVYVEDRIWATRACLLYTSTSTDPSAYNEVHCYLSKRYSV